MALKIPSGPEQAILILDDMPVIVNNYIVSIHDHELRNYLDEAGENLYHIVRTEFKKFLRSVWLSLPGIVESVPTQYTITDCPEKSLSVIIEQVSCSIRNWFYFIDDQFAFRHPHANKIDEYEIETIIFEGSLTIYRLTTPSLCVLIEELKAVLVMLLRDQARYVYERF